MMMVIIRKRMIPNGLFEMCGGWCYRAALSNIGREQEYGNER